MEKEKYNQLGGVILNSAYSVHKEMGPGLLEAVYQQCTVRELTLRNVKINTMVIVPLVYKGYTLNKDYIVDILAEQEIIIELKAVECILPIHEAQIISYMKLANKKLGYLINF